MKLRTIIMTADCRGCPDGVNVRSYFAGAEYNLPESLGRAFIEDLKVAEDVVVKTAEQIAEEAEIEAAKQLAAEEEAILAKAAALKAPAPVKPKAKKATT